MNDMDYKEVIAEARNHVEHFAITGGDGVRVTRLADAIESLLAGRDALQAQLDNMTTETRVKQSRIVGVRPLIMEQRLVGPWVEVSD